MAGKELKATEKTVLKHSRDGVLEQNLADGSAKKVSNKAEEAVLKTARPDDERFDKLKAAGLVVEDVKKPDHRKLQFGRNNPDNTWAEAVYGKKPTEQLSFISDEKYQNSETCIPVTVEEFAEMRQTPFKAEELKNFDLSKTRLKHMKRKVSVLLIDFFFCSHKLLISSFGNTARCFEYDGHNCYGWYRNKSLSL